MKKAVCIAIWGFVLASLGLMSLGRMPEAQAKSIVAMQPAISNCACIPDRYAGV